MAPLHANCGKECLQCVLDWYRLGSSEDEEGDEGSSQISPPRNTIVLDSLSPSDLGTQVGETEFDDACSSYVPEDVVPDPKDVVLDPKDVVPDVKHVDSEPKRDDLFPLCVVSEPQSPRTKGFNAFVKRFMDRHK